MRRIVGICACVMILAGCEISTSPRRTVVTNNQGQQGWGGQQPPQQGWAGQQPGGVSDDPRTALNQIDAHMTSQGFRRIGPAVRNANMPTGGIIAYAIDAQPGSCYTSVAIAGASADLNMVVLDPAGRTVSYNVNPDAHPWVTMCPQQAGRHVARLQMVSGAGEYYYALYQGPGNNQLDLASLFGDAQAAPAQAQTASLDAESAARLAALDQQLAPDRYRRAGEPHGIQLTRGEDRNFPLNLQQGYCYAFATIGGPGTQDTDVFVVDGSGNQLEQDVSAQRDALVRYCPPQSGSYTLRARLYSGEGPLFVAGWVQQQTAAAVQPTTNVISQNSTAGAGLEENFRLIHSEMQARGYEAFGQPSRGSLEQGATRDFAVSFEGGKCYAILAVGDNGVRDLDILLLDAGGDQIDQDVDTDARPIVRVCPQQTGQYRMQVRMFSGAGNFVYAAYQWPRGTRGPFGLEGLIYVRLAEVTALLQVEGYEPDVEAEPGQGSLRRQGTSRSHNVTLAANTCYGILAVGGIGVNDLNATLSQGNTEIANDGTRNAFPTLRFCTQQAGRYSLNVEAQAGQGDYFFQVFRRSGG